MRCAESVVKAGRLRAVTSPEPAEAFLIAVPTPVSEDASPDLRYVDAAAGLHRTGAQGR
jgi:UDP-N-acetyl-D-mannosaminuronic acid dehydrogenase